MLASALVVLVVLALPIAASAKVTFTSVVAKPIAPSSKCTTLEDVPTITQAGKAADFCVALATSGGADPQLGDLPGLGDDLKNLTLALPLGQAASVKAAPLCPRPTFLSKKGCPSVSQVGELSLAVDVLGAGRIDERLLQGKVFNLEPQGTEGTRLGLSVNVVIGPLNVEGVIHLETEARLRPSDNGLESVTLNNPRDLEGIPLELRRLNLRLWGDKADHPTMQTSFMTSPTTCTPAVTRVTGESYAGITSTAQTSFTPTGCDKLGLTPDGIFESGRVADEPGELTSGVTLPAADGGLAQSHIRKTTVVLPEGFELSPTVGNRPGFTGCDDAQLGKGELGPATCPAASQIGTVAIRSPLLLNDELPGRIYLANPKPGEAKVRFFVVAEAGPERDAVRLKIVARTIIDPNTGQLTTVLDDLPPTPFTTFRFSFFGGENGSIKMPRACGTYTADTILEPWNGTPTKTVKTSVSVDQGCRDPEPFAPELAASVSPDTAASATSLTTVFTRPAGHGRMRSMVVDLPTGLTGRLTAAAQCPLALAATGSCGDDSRIGRVRALAGGGPAPKPLTGDVYLTEGPGGALAGLNIVVDVKVGPLDFGRVITQATIEVEQDTSLRLIVPEIPLRQQGVEANIRQLEVVLDRAGFNVNATSCAPKTFTGSITSDTGAVASVSSPYQPTGCENLPFGPKIEATIAGGPNETKENGHPSLDVVVSQTPGQANSSKMEVVLPEGLAPDGARLQSICPLEVYEQNACPPETVKGSATAYTPLLPKQLSGPVTFVKIPGEPLPGLRIKLQGAISLDLTGRVRFGDRNRVVNVIDPIPDTPLSRFELSLKTGPNAMLVATKDLCQSKTNTIDGTAWSHAGGQTAIKAEANVVDCAPAGTLKLGSLRSGRPTLDLRVNGGRTRVTTAQLVVPSGLEFQRAAIVKKRLKITATGLKKGSKARVTVSGQSIKVTVPSGQSATVLRVRMSSGGLRASTRLRKRGRPQLTFRLNTTTADKKSSRASLRVRPAAR
ncbi:hypothetical protein LRS13_01130 [Svornostia abyssi]|uniref:Uncharacterized protein n=1 Tax=Svornostia abyssi TaxID=2898438 RepID=A0ABY5PHL7_9ACTN|nr:hypothetical protein LRS13_01130 [Parviterribacteraceae bacterium J379]